MRKILLVLMLCSILCSSYIVLGLNNYIPFPTMASIIYPDARERALPDFLYESNNSFIRGLQEDFTICVYSSDDNFKTVSKWYMDKKKDDGWCLYESIEVYDNESISFWKKGVVGELILIDEKLLTEYYECNAVIITMHGSLTTFYKYYYNQDFVSFLDEYPTNFE